MLSLAGSVDLSGREIWFLDRYFGKDSYYVYAVNAFHNAFPEGKGIPVDKIHVPQGIFYHNGTIVHSDTLDRIFEENPGDYSMLGPEVFILPNAEHPVLQGIEASTRDYEANLPSERLQILGIGVEGHIGFNEEGTLEDSVTHLGVLAPSTIEANADDFNDGIKTRYYVTLGTASIMEGHTAVLLANGGKKIEAVYGLLHGNNSASVLRNHPNVYVFLTRDTLGLCDLDELKKDERIEIRQ
ncbi:hypothetical protein CMO89_00035 [Candidatus Woesearchaeota archaeon]|nr:hypothetical protein [Candidatus Woesearchaeota archaeon]|tara:strand:- start:3604 stop:4326 length:723 start_codon:yes stop_codon:yes gene_type:complete